MKLFFNLLACDFKRTVFSLRFLVAAVGFTVITFVTMFDELPHLQSGVTSLVYIDQIIRYLDFHITYLIFAAIPGTILFCTDWDNRFIRFSVVRCSKRKYAFSKVFACFTSAVLVVFLSEVLTLSLFALRFPVFSDTDGNLGIYSTFASADKIILFFFVKILCEAFCAGFLSIFALWFSTKITNSFVALATPLLAFYLISTIGFALQIPVMFNISALSKGYVYICNHPSISFWYTILMFTIAAMIFGWFFVKSCTRRIEYG